MIHYFRDGSCVDFSQESIGYVRLENILFSLGVECRFSNQAPLSVLEHSISVGLTAEKIYSGNHQLIQAAYCHDFAEAIIRDVPTPIKELVGKNWYDVEYAIEKKLLKALKINCYPLGDEDLECLKEIDRAVCYVEALKFFGKEFADVIMSKFPKKPNDYVLVIATTSVEEASGYNLWTEEDSEILNPGIINMYKQVVNLGID